MCQISKRMTKSLMVSILTFSFGVGVVLIWQSFGSSPASIGPKQEIIERTESLKPTSNKQNSLCEEIKHLRGERAHKKRPIDGGVLNGKSCFVEPV